jgi:hypothetical protein
MAQFELERVVAERVAIELDDVAEGRVSFVGGGGFSGAETGDVRRRLSFFETIIQSIYKMLDPQ